MNKEFKSSIIEAKEALKDKETALATFALEKATEILDAFSQEELNENLVLIGDFHRLNMRFLQNFVQNSSPEDTNDALSIHLGELQKLELAELDDYLRISHLPEKFSIDIFEKIILENPKHAPLIRDMGRGYLHNKEYHKAFICLKKAKNCQPEDLSTFSLLYECCNQYASVLQSKEMLNEVESELLLMLFTEISDSISCLTAIKIGIFQNLNPEVTQNYQAIAYFRSGNIEEASNLWYQLQENNKLSHKSKLYWAEFESYNTNKQQVDALLDDYPTYQKSNYSKVKNIDDLLQIWEKEITNNLSDTLLVLAIKAQMNLLYREPEKALENINAGLKLRATDPMLLKLKSEFLAKKEDFGEAESHLILARKYGLSEAKYFLEMAQLCFKQSKWKEAFELINVYHQLDLVTQKSAYLGGVAAKNAGNTNLAYQLLNICINDFPTHVNYTHALYQRALLSRSVSRLEDAMIDVDQAIQNELGGDVFYAQLLELKADILFNKRSYQKASSYLTQAHRIRPLEGQSLLHLQIILHDNLAKMEEKPQDIPPLSLNSIILQPKTASDHVCNAKVYATLEKLMEAAESYKKAAELGLLPEYHYKMAFHCALKAEAKSYLVEIYQILQANYIVDFNTTAQYAFALYQLERYEEAIAAYEDMAYTYPEMMETDKNRQIWSHTIAHSHQQLGNYEDAIQYYSILLSHMNIYDRGYMKRLQEIAELRNDKNDFSRYSLLQYMKSEKITLSEEEEKKLEFLRLQFDQQLQVIGK